MDRSYPVTSHYQINRSASQSIHLCIPIVGERIKKNTCNISKGDLHIHVMVSYPVIKLIVYLQFFNRYYSQLRITKSHSEKKNEFKKYYLENHPFLFQILIKYRPYQPYFNRPTFLNIFRGKVIFFSIIRKTFNVNLRCNKSCKI